MMYFRCGSSPCAAWKQRKIPSPWACRTIFAAIWIHDNYLDLISQRLRMAAAAWCRSTCARSTPRPAPPAHPCPRPRPGPPPSARSATTNVRPPPVRSNPRNTFENFVVGQNNQLAHARRPRRLPKPRAGLQSAFHPRLHGPGQDPPDARHRAQHPPAQPRRQDRVPFHRKVHQRVHPRHPGERADQVPPALPATWTSCWSTTSSSSPARSASRRNFFHTFNDLFESQKQIVLSSDRPVTEIATLEARARLALPVGPVGRHPVPGFRDPRRHSPHQGRHAEGRTCPCP